MSTTTPADLDATITVRRWIRTGQARAVREAAGLSQAELAAMAGTQAQAVSRWENGKTPRAAQAVRYHDALVHAQRITAAADAVLPA